MTWLAIGFWILRNLPDMIALFRRIFKRAETMQVAQSGAMREEYVAIIKSKTLLKPEKKLLVRQLILTHELRHVTETLTNVSV